MRHSKLPDLGIRFARRWRRGFWLGFLRDLPEKENYVLIGGGLRCSCSRSWQQAKKAENHLFLECFMGFNQPIEKLTDESIDMSCSQVCAEPQEPVRSWHRVFHVSLSLFNIKFN